MNQVLKDVPIRLMKNIRIRQLIEQYCIEDKKVDVCGVWGVLVFENVTFRNILLKTSIVTIGRARNCTIFINEDEISNLHCILSCKKKQVCIQDWSQNGTWLNRIRIPRDELVFLGEKDQITILKAQNKEITFKILYPWYNHTERVLFSQMRYEKEKDMKKYFNCNYLTTESGNQYQMIEFIGMGNFSRVFKAINVKNKIPYAIKFISKRNTSSNTFSKELKILQEIKHDHIIQFFETVETQTHYALIMEFVEGQSLYDQVIESGYLFVETEAQKIFYQLVSALLYLHQKDIVHRDLKLDNILFLHNETGLHIKLIDFGLSRKIPKNQNQLMFTCCGSRLYTAPEILDYHQTQGYTKMIDIWSLGVILFMILSGRKPFLGHHIELQENMKAGNFSLPIDLYWSAELCDLLRQLLQFDVQKRIPLNKILTHPWMSSLH